MSDLALATPTIRSPSAEFWRRFRRKHVALVSGGVLLLLIVAAAAAPWIAPYGPTTPDYDNVLAGPSWQHLCGTDTFGRDIFSRILWGGRISLTVGFVSVALGGMVGVVLGLVSGFFGGLVDGFIMRLMDVLLAFPGILLAIGVVALLGPGIDNVIYAIAVFSVPVFARLVRGSTLALKQTMYVQAARSIGVRAPMLMLRHILPGTRRQVVEEASERGEPARGRSDPYHQRGRTPTGRARTCIGLSGGLSLLILSPPAKARRPRAVSALYPPVFGNRPFGKRKTRKRRGMLPVPSGRIEPMVAKSASGHDRA